MKLTVDASVVVKWFVREPLFEEARLLLAHRLRLYAPDILLAEFANTIWKKARQNEIPDTRPYLDELQSLAEIISLCPINVLIARAAEIAQELDHPVYDCLYLACAEATESVLVTADYKFVKKVASAFGSDTVRTSAALDLRTRSAPQRLRWSLDARKLRNLLPPTIFSPIRKSTFLTPSTPRLRG